MQNKNDANKELVKYKNYDWNLNSYSMDIEKRYSREKNVTMKSVKQGVGILVHVQIQSRVIKVQISVARCKRLWSSLTKAKVRIRVPCWSSYHVFEWRYWVLFEPVVERFLFVVFGRSVLLGCSVPRLWHLKTKFTSGLVLRTGSMNRVHRQEPFHQLHP